MGRGVGVLGSVSIGAAGDACSARHAPVQETRRSLFRTGGCRPPALAEVPHAEEYVRLAAPRLAPFQLIRQLRCAVDAGVKHLV